MVSDGGVTGGGIRGVGAGGVAGLVDGGVGRGEGI